MAEIVLRFHDVKDAKRLQRNLMKGKGTILSNKHVGGFNWSSIGSMAKDAGKQIVKSDLAKNLVKKGINTVVNKGAEFIDSRTGNTGIASSVGNALGNVAVQQAQAQMDKAGEGMKRGRPRKGKGKASTAKKSLKLPKGLEIYESRHMMGGSFLPLG